MKKTITVLLAAFAAICLAAGLVSCGEKHEHSFSAEWSADETYHWHACEGKDCDEVSDKATHTFDDGKITREATKDAKGIKTYTCTVCKKTKTEEVEYVAKTTVTEDEWKEAVNLFYKNLTWEATTSYEGENLPSYMTDETRNHGKTELLADGSIHTFGFGWGESYYKVNADGTVSGIFLNSSGKWERYSTKYETLKDYEEGAYGDDVGYMGAILPAYTENFSLYAYDEATASYKGTVKMPMPDGSSYDYAVEIKFEDGKMTALKSVATSGGVTATLEFKFYDYGTTVINFPTVE